MKGNPQVEQFMEQVSAAIQRQMGGPNAGTADIYNRAYEAIDAAVKAREREIVAHLRILESTWEAADMVEAWLEGQR